MRRRPVAPGLAELADRLSDRFETRVKVDLGQTAGRISVEFATMDDLRRIVDIIDPQASSSRLSALVASADGGAVDEPVDKRSMARDASTA